MNAALEIAAVEQVRAAVAVVKADIDPKKMDALIPAEFSEVRAAIAAQVIAATIDTEEWPFGTVRDEVMNIWGIVRFALILRRFGRRDDPWDFKSLAALFSYGCDEATPPPRKEKPVNVDSLVTKWVPIIRGLSSAHSKDEIDRCEFESEQYLSPLLTAPVKQLREFYSKLCKALREDPTIPFFVHTVFDGYHEAIVKHAPDADVKELKVQLATEVADLVEKDIVPDIREAIIGALKWRSAGTLKEVKAAVEAGAKPRLRGKESCLFLVVPKVDGSEATVML